ncbi:MAG: BON domain-containing protein [Deferribacteres bacterium]|nr:BON domain-containing protein [candidate division KSB1 bacterium]MCB9512447.1 BON domain-containing protein [Deferribacteres bacterium]
MCTTKRFLTAIFAILLASQPLSAQQSSSKLKSKVQDEIARYYEQSIGVSIAEPGIVTLKGSVKSYWDKLNLWAIVSKVPSVHQIKNDIVVDTQAVPDNIITSEIRHYLDLNKAIEDPKKIEITADNGLVFLRGEVNSIRESEIVEDIAAWHKGVKSIENELRVLPPKAAMSDANLATILRDMIKRDFPLEKKSIQIEVMNGVAKITGTVERLWVVKQVEKEVRRIQGITGVDNQLKIQVIS